MKDKVQDVLIEAQKEKKKIPLQKIRESLQRLLFKGAEAKKVGGAPVRSIGETLKGVFSHPAVFTGALGAAGGAGIGALSAPEKKELKGALIGALAGGTAGGVGGLIAKTVGAPKAWKAGFEKGESLGTALGNEKARKISSEAIKRMENAKEYIGDLLGVPPDKWQEGLQQASELMKNVKTG